MTTPTKYDTATPYIAAYVILRDGNNIAMVLRSNTKWMDGHYSLLAGKVEKNETFSQAAIREAKEEGGVTIALANLHLKLIVQRHSGDSDWIDAIFEVTEWEGEAYNAEPHVHGELAWFAIDNVPENTTPAVKMYLQTISEGKSYLEYGWDD